MVNLMGFVGCSKTASVILIVSSDVSFKFTHFPAGLLVFLTQYCLTNFIFVKINKLKIPETQHSIDFGPLTSEGLQTVSRKAKIVLCSLYSMRRWVYAKTNESVLASLHLLSLLITERELEDINKNTCGDPGKRKDASLWCWYPS
jgi:hypothetical protein